MAVWEVLDVFSSLPVRNKILLNLVQNNHGNSIGAARIPAAPMRPRSLAAGIARSSLADRRGEKVRPRP